MWRRIKKFNTKLIITNAMRRLRTNVLVSVRPVWGVPSISALFPDLAVRSSGMILVTQCSCAATTGFNLIPVILAGGTLSLLAFQGVRPVTRSISPRMRWESCALKAGSVSGFPMGLVKPQVCTRSPRWRLRWYARVYQSRDKTVSLL